MFKERAFYGLPPEEAPLEPSAELEARVAHFLARVAGLDASDVSVISRGKTIVLGGAITTPEESKRAEEAVMKVRGVAGVINRIAIGHG